MAERCECGKCQEARRRDDDESSYERIAELEEALRPFADAFAGIEAEGNIGGAYDRVGREHFARAAEVIGG